MKELYTGLSGVGTSLAVALGFCLMGQCASAQSYIVIAPGGAEQTDANKDYDSGAGSTNTVEVLEDAYYEAVNVNITNTLDEKGVGVHADGAEYVRFGADEGQWATVKVTGGDGRGIRLVNMKDDSYIYNTRVYKTGATGLGIVSSNGTAYLGNVQVFLTPDEDIASDLGVAIQVSDGGYMSNKGADGTILGDIYVETNAHGAGRGIVAVNGATGDFYNTTMNIAKTDVDNNTRHYAAITAVKSSTLNLTDSSIVSANDNCLITGNGQMGMDGGTSYVKLDNVDLTRALDQRIVLANTTTLNLSIVNGTALDGYAVLFSGGVDNTLNMSLDAASWHVTRASMLGDAGVLSLVNGSVLTLDIAGEGDFSSIVGAAMMIESGCVINIDVTGYAGGSMDFTLLTGTLNIDEGVAVNLIGATANQDWDTSRLMSEGVVSVVTVPEPATATLGLLGLASFMVRRRRG